MIRGAVGRLLDAWSALWRRLAGLEPARPLCDSCKLDYGSACRRPERPNARRCPDYQRR